MIVIVFGIQNDQINPEVENIAEKHKTMESARRMIFSLISSKGGRIVGQVHGNEIVTLPIDQSEIVKEIHRRLKEEVGIANTIGVGEDARQALKALSYAKEKCPNSVKVYEPEMEREEEEMQKSEYTPISDEERAKIAQSMQSLHQNKEIMDSIRQDNPEAYSSIVSVVQSLSMILEKDKEEGKKYQDKMIKKINQYLKSQMDKQNDKHAKVIQREIDKHYKAADKEKKEKFNEFHKKRSEKRSRSRKILKANPEHELLAYLMGL